MINNKNTYSISEVSDRTGFKPHVIRFYEKEFNLNIPREDNNRRYFTNKEIDQLLYIKKLQSSGSSNKKIKEILQTEENIENEIAFRDDIAVSTLDDLNNIADILKNTDNTILQFKNEVLIILEKYNYKNEINELKQKIEELTQQLNNEEKTKDKDVLICENAKLKLKLKEKSYEIAELKDKLKKQEYQKTSIFQRILKTKSAT